MVVPWWGDSGGEVGLCIEVHIATVIVAVIRVLVVPVVPVVPVEGGSYFMVVALLTSQLLMSLLKVLPHLLEPG